MFSQIFEKLTSYVEKYDVLYQYQFGFMKARSTEQATAEVANNLKQSIDNNLFTWGIFGFHQGLRYSQSRHTAGQISMAFGVVHYAGSQVI